MKHFFSIVTPVYNCEQYIEKCILSVKNQSCRNYEHIIIDGGSTDGTLAIIHKYEGTYSMRYISEADQGMYDAICKGFTMAKGDIFAWLNADDMFMPWCLDIMNKAFEKPAVQWVTGMKACSNRCGTCFSVQPILYSYHSGMIKKGYYDGRALEMLQQESTFFAKELWEKSYPELWLKEYKMAGDYFLWRKFAEYEKLYVVSTVISSFRFHEGQKTEVLDDYYKEIGKQTIGCRIAGGLWKRKLCRGIMKQLFFSDMSLIISFQKGEFCL